MRKEKNIGKKQIKKKTIFGINCAMCGKVIKTTTNLEIPIKESSETPNP